MNKFSTAEAVTSWSEMAQQNKLHFQTRSLRGRKLSFRFTPIFNSDIQLSVYSFSCFTSVCPFVALLKAACAENSHIVFSCRYLKQKRPFLTSCVLSYELPHRERWLSRIWTLIRMRSGWAGYELHNHERWLSMIWTPSGWEVAEQDMNSLRMRGGWAGYELHNDEISYE